MVSRLEAYEEDRNLGRTLKYPIAMGEIEIVRMVCVSSSIDDYT